MSQSQVLAKSAGQDVKVEKKLSSESRKGRDKQRYDETGARLVMGAVPYTFQKNALHIMLVFSRKHEEWLLPKGGWENDETDQACAERETWEEAGVTGTVQTGAQMPANGKEQDESGTSLGIREPLFPITSRVRKAKKNTTQVHSYFPLAISNIMEEYPEIRERKRKLMPWEECRTILASQMRRDDMPAQLKAIDAIVPWILRTHSPTPQQ